jgi:hypothetical protein
MPVPVVQYTPVTPARGGLVHATTLARPGVTACGRKFRAWVVALQPLNCQDCKREIHIKMPKNAKRLVVPR